MRMINTAKKKEEKKKTHSGREGVRGQYKIKEEKSGKKKKNRGDNWVFA